MVKKGLLCLVFTCVLCLANMATALASFEYGDNGPEVLAIQKRLVELKYEIKLLDGDFGSETEAAVKRFQADKQLEVDGIIGEATYTALMNKPMPPNRSGRSATIRNVIRAAYGVIGTPYVFGGTSVYGFDCSGFTQYAFAMYSGKQISASQLRPGDLIFFSTYEPGPSHCGIYLGNGQFIHAGSSTGVTVASAFTGYWGARYYGACRII